MSTKPTSPAVSTASSILTILQGANGYVTLAVEVAGVLVPLAKALIQKIEGIGAGNLTITFSDLVAADMAELDAIIKLSNDDLATVNAELAKLGLPALPANPPAGS